MTSTALITGAAGQDGVLLARHLLSMGHRVVGTLQPDAHSPLRPYLEGVVLEDHDLRDVRGFDRLLDTYEPDEVYNLAGLTSVAASRDDPGLVMEVNATAVESMLSSLVKRGGTRFFQASSSEVFGPDASNPQDELTPHDPQNPYAESKSRAHHATVRAREEQGLHATVGILYNHESVLRGRQFVTRKITRAAAEIGEGLRDTVTLGALDVSRDWGAARDYVRGMHAALQHPTPSDYVFATGRLHTVSELLEVAFAAAGMDDPWPYVVQDPTLLRRGDPRGPRGDARKALQDLRWSATTTFAELINEMVSADQRRVRTGVEEAPGYLAN